MKTFLPNGGEFDTPDIREKTIANLVLMATDGKTARRNYGILFEGNAWTNVIITQILDVFVLGAGTMLRFERDE